MVFPEYEKEKIRYETAFRRCGEILLEKEKLFSKTQPTAVQFDKEKVTSTTVNNTFDNYVIELEKKKINERIEEAHAIILVRRELLMIKEQDLRNSRHCLDMVYVCKYLDGMNAYQIAEALHYSKSQVYRAIDKIKKISKRDKMGQNGTE